MLNHKSLTLPLFIFSALLFVSYIIPFHYHPYRSYYNDACAIFSVIFALAWMSLTESASLPGKTMLRIPGVVVLPLVLIVVIAFQTLSGLLLYPIDSFFPILYLICFLIALIFGATVAAHPDGLSKLSFALASVFLAAGLISVIFQWMQLINLNWYPYVMPLLHDRNPRPFGNLGQPNLLSLLMCFSVASCWYLYVTQRIRANAGLGFVALLLMGCALTQARIAWIILPLWMLLCWHQPVGCPKVSKPVLIFLSLFFIFLVIFTPDVVKDFGIVLDTAGERASQTSVRLVLWEQAWVISSLHPWFGAGWFQFGAQQAMLSPLFPPTEYSDYAHNIVLDLAATIGWPITLVILLSALYWFYRCCIRHWVRLQVRFMSMVLLAMWLHSQVEFPLWFAYMLIPFGVIVGALSCQAMVCRDVIIAKSAMVVGLIASVLAISAITWDFNRVVDGFKALAWQQAGQTQGIGSTEKPEITLFPQFYDYFQVAKIDIHPGMSKEDIQFIERVAVRFAFTPILGRLALAYVDNQQPTEALQVLIVIHRLNGSGYPQIYANWKGYAQQYPEVYGEIFKRMPEPEEQLLPA